MGASSTSTPLRRHSCASSLPIASTRSQSQVAASAVGDGTFADVSRSSQVSPRTPAGPSEVTSLRSPAPGSAYSAQKSAPVSSWTFCARERRGDPAPQLVLGQDRGHVLFAGHGVGRLTRDASAARCASGVPKAIESAFARFRYRCAGCSQVKPMPPCICTHSWAASTATSEQ